MLLAGLLSIALLGIAATAVLSGLPNGAAQARVPGASSVVAAGVASTSLAGSPAADPAAEQSGVVVGDEPLPGVANPTGEPGTTAGSRPATPIPAPIPQPTVKPHATPTSPAIPTLPPTPIPTSTPTPTPPPTPTPAANFVAFEPAGSTRGGDTATYSVSQGTNFTFIIDGLGGARCTLSSSPRRSGAPPPQAIPGIAPQRGSLAVTTWGMYWPLGIYTVTATCTLAGQPTATATQSVHVVA